MNTRGCILLFMLLPLTAAAQTRTLYFDRNGEPAAAPGHTAYLREYDDSDGKTAVGRDYYYPSRRPYSDEYRVPLAQIRRFVLKPVDGTLTLWYINGRKKTEVHYKNGLPDGTWTNWYANGEKSAQITYIKGKSEGTGLRFYPTGRKESEIEFRNDKAEGIWRQWYADGSEKTEALMHDNRPVRMINWDESGRPVAEMSWSEGRRSGVLTEWYPDGGKRSESIYRDDRLVGRIKWGPDGEVLSAYGPTD